jgi:hypothetical protein
MISSSPCVAASTGFFFLYLEKIYFYTLTRILGYGKAVEISISKLSLHVLGSLT